MEITLVTCGVEKRAGWAEGHWITRVEKPNQKINEKSQVLEDLGGGQSMKNHGFGGPWTPLGRCGDHLGPHGRQDVEKLVRWTPSWVHLGSLLGAILTTLGTQSRLFSDLLRVIFRVRILRGFGHHFRWPNLEKS